MKNKIGYGLIGLGNIGRLHLMVLKNLPIWNLFPEGEVGLSGLLSTHPEKNFPLAHQIGFRKIVSDLDDFLLLQDLNLVDICTPNYLHREQVLASAQKGKHIYCEKPLGINTREAEEMLVAVEENNVHHQLPFVLRFLPAVAHTRRILNENLLGRVYRIQAELLHSSYLDPSRPMAWRLDQKMAGGGALADLGSHLIDLLLFLFGEIEPVHARMKTVIKSRTNSNGKVEKVTVDDWSFLELKIGGDIHSTIEVSRLAAGKEGLRVSIYGERGTLYLQEKNPHKPLVYNHRGKVTDPAESHSDEYLELLKKCYPPERLSGGWLMDTHAASLVWFLQRIIQDSKKAETPDFFSGVAVQKILDQAYHLANPSPN